jgi:hypothetical protein
MAYPQPYPSGQGQAFNQVIRRPLTDAERQLPAGVFRTFQRGLRGISVVCLILFVFNMLVLPAVITDPITYDSVSMTLYVFMFVLGAVSIGMSVNAIVIRKRVEQAMRDGTAVEVLGPAYRSGGVGKAQAWTVGPVSMIPTREVMGILREGMMTSVLCVPSMKAAIAVNNCGLKFGARIMFPQNLEAMAVPMGVQAPFGGQASPPYQGFAPQRGYSEELPPPPPPD